MFFIYTRVSTVEQATDDKTSLQEQERVCRGVAMARGVDKFDIDLFSDPGESGATPLKFRKAGKIILNLAKSGDIVCAAKLDRLFRSAGDALNTIQELKERGVGVILPEFGLEPITAEGVSKLFFGMLALVAEFERDVINGRMRLGKSAKIAKGGHGGGDPRYGFKVIGRGRDSRVEIDPGEQEVVALVTRLKKRGESLGQIKRRLDKDGIKTRTGREFAKVQIRRIIISARNDRMAAA